MRPKYRRRRVHPVLQREAVKNIPIACLIVATIYLVLAALLDVLP